MNSPANALVLAAHPDDEVLGCGGTMARLADEGRTVHVAALGEGMTSRLGPGESVDRSALEALRSAGRNAAAILGATSIRFFDLPDNRFDEKPLLEIVKIIEGLIEELRPDAVFTQHGGDLNIDHSLVFRATLTATRPLMGSSVKSVYAYEVPSSTEWAFQRISPVFRPTVFVDISDTIDRKIKAIRRYDSETRPFPHPRSEEALRSIAARWGSAAGVYAAEAFELVRMVV